MVPNGDVLDQLHALTDRQLAAAIRLCRYAVADYAAELPPHARDLAAAGDEACTWYCDRHDAGYAFAADPLRRLLAEAARRNARPRRRSFGRVTIAALLAAHGDRMRPAGLDRWRAACPWHDDSSPSLMIYADGHVHCFACGAHRGLADLAAAWREAAA